MGFQVECVNGLDLDIMLGSFSVNLRILSGGKPLPSIKRDLGCLRFDDAGFHSVCNLVDLSFLPCCLCVSGLLVLLVAYGILGDVFMQGPVRNLGTCCECREIHSFGNLLEDVIPEGFILHEFGGPFSPGSFVR